MGGAAKKWMAAVEDPSKLVADNYHLAGELAASMRREQEILAENQKLKDKLAAAPRWVPVAEWVGDYGWHYVAASNGLCYDAKRKGSRWFPAYAEASLDVDVTHVLVGLNAPVIERDIDPRGDGDIEEVTPDTSLKMTTEQMSDAFDKMIETTRKMDEPPESAKPKRDLFVAESPNGPWHVWEQKTPGDYTLVAGPFHSAELAHAAADEIRADEDTSNDLAGDASDIERAMRRRLMEPFYGSEAERLGATKYQLRDMERWEYLKRGVEWDFVDGLPCWFDDDTYRLAIGD